MKKSILELAKVVRSKNSGPYEIVMDVLFKDEETYAAVKKSTQFSKEIVANLYRVKPDFIENIIWFDPANAVKIVMPRNIVSGAVGDTDVYGAQQHAPLLKMEFNINNPLFHLVR